MFPAPFHSPLRVVPVFLVPLLFLVPFAGCGDSRPSMATAIEQDYIGQMVDQISRAGNSLNSLAMMYGSPAPDDDEWRQAVEVLLGQMVASHEDSASLQPPRSLRDFHAKARETLLHWDACARIVRADYDDGVYEFSEAAEVELAAADEAFEEADAMLNQFLTEHPLPQPDGNGP